MAKVEIEITFRIKPEQAAAHGGYRGLYHRGLQCRLHSTAFRQAISCMEFLRPRDRILPPNRFGHRVARRLRLFH
jgi:hypothetical protein